MNGVPIQIIPRISWPRSVRAGESYELHIDLNHGTAPEEWPYKLEEYPLTCLLETRPLFNHKPLGDSTILLHRFGGSYGGTRFLLRAADQERSGKVRITFLNGSGVPVYSTQHEVKIQGGPAPSTYRARVARQRSYQAEVPPSRINIRYIKYIGDAQEKVELPFKLLLLGDYPKTAAELDFEAEIDDRRRVDIDRQSFAEVMAGQNLSLALGVPNHLDSDYPTRIELTFPTMEAFTPDGIVGAWPVLRREALLRRGLVLLNQKLQESRAFRDELVELLKRPKARSLFRHDLVPVRYSSALSAEVPIANEPEASLKEVPISLKEELNEVASALKEHFHQLMGFLEGELVLLNPWRTVELYLGLFQLLETFDEDDTSYLDTGSLDTLSDEDIPLTEELMPDLKRLIPERIDAAIQDLDLKMTAQVDEVLHHPEFQALESFWRGLKFLLDRTDFRRKIKIEWLPVSKEELADDFEGLQSSEQSGLYRHVHDFEYDQAGGEPFAAMIGLFEVDHRDVVLLHQISEVAAQVQAPFIASAAPSLFGLSSMSELPRLKGKISETLNGPNHSNWTDFKDVETSRFVTLTLPRFLLRSPYGVETSPAKSFAYEETSDEDDHYLWGPSSLALAACLTRSFADNGWGVNIRGPQSGGLVEDLPMIFREGRSRSKIPTESLLTGHLEPELQAQGLAPLSFYKNKDYACFFEVPTLQKPAQTMKSDGTIATYSSHHHAELAYLFLTTRIAHYFKVLQRENIGASASREDLSWDLDQWLQTLVTEMPNPDADLKARCPFQAASVSIPELPESHPKAHRLFEVQVHLQPHFRAGPLFISLYLPRRIP